MSTAKLYLRDRIVVGTALCSNLWRLSRSVSVDQIGEVNYESGRHFTRHTRTSAAGRPVVVFDDAEPEASFSELQSELEPPLPGVEVLGLQLFSDLSEDSRRSVVECPRFGQAKVGSASQIEQHVAVQPPAHDGLLSPTDQFSVAHSLAAARPALEGYVAKSARGR